MLRKFPFEHAYVIVARWDAVQQDDKDPSDDGEEDDRGNEAAEGTFLEEGFAGEERSRSCCRSSEASRPG